MTSILSSISGRFSFSLLLGTFVPAIVFILLARMLVVPLVPGALDVALLTPLKAIDESWEIFAILLSAIVLSGLLYSLNTPLIRIYEGYPWQDTWLGRKRCQRYEAELDALSAHKEGWIKLYAALSKQLEDLSQDDPAQEEPEAEPDSEVERLKERMAAVRESGNEAARRINEEFPKRASVLPTRLGNAIRAFENYPERQYQMAGIALYPRLIAKIDKEYAGSIDEAKASVDFTLNSATLSTLLALGLLLAGLVYPKSLPSLAAWALWLAGIVFFVLVAGWFYGQSIGRARAWGTMVKGAFDLYRGELLEQLGYDYAPATTEEERAIWSNISKRLIYGDPPKGRAVLVPYKAADKPKSEPTSVQSETGAALELLRGIGRADSDGVITVSIQVRNGDQDGKDARGVVLTDTIADGYGFEWDSATVSSGGVRVTGANPYHFHCDAHVNPNDRLLLTYRIVPSVSETLQIAGRRRIPRIFQMLGL
jgi:hypothetical protein